jgi:hypothetical protein
MDEKGNVSFVSGLALILSALALLLIGIMQISSRPYDETMEAILEKNLDAIEKRVDLKIEVGMKKLEKAEENAALRELKYFSSNLNAWLTSGANGFTNDAKVLKKNLDILILNMEGGPKAPAANSPVAKKAPPAKK